MLFPKRFYAAARMGRAMAKLLPVTGIVAAVLTVILVLANLTIIQVVGPVLAILAGVFAILENRRGNMVLGVTLIIAGAILAFFAVPGGVSGKGDAQVGANGGWASWFAVLGGVLAILAVVGARYAALMPAWTGMAAVACAVVALALCAWKVDNLGAGFADVGNAWPLYLSGLLLLAAGYPNLVALRRSPETVVTTTTHTTHVSHTAAAEAAHEETHAHTTHTTAHTAKPKAAKKKAAPKRKA